MEYIDSIDIDAPPERVWAVMRDIDRWPEWTPTISSVTRVNGRPFAVGTHVRIRQPRLPEAEWVISAIDENRGFEWESRAPAVHVLARHIVEPRGARSRVTLSVRYNGVIGVVFGWLIAGINRRYIALEAEGLKRRVEGASTRS